MKMTKAIFSYFLVTLSVLALTVGAIAQSSEPKLPEGMKGSDTTDKRASLTPGLFDAGEAASGMKHLTLLKKPTAFRLGTTDPDNKRVIDTLKSQGIPNAAMIPGPFRLVFAQLAFANSDLAFQGDKLFLGNFYGVNIYDISNPAKTKLITSMVCPGGQGDVSVHGNLMFMSVEAANGRLDCGEQGFPVKTDGKTGTPGVEEERFRGVRIFDISDVKKPQQVAAVQTCRGSHTHTLVEDPKDKKNVYIYVSGTSFVRPSGELAGCSDGTPDKNKDTSRFSIDIIKVPVDKPQDSKIIASPRIFKDEKTGAINGLSDGGSHENKGKPSDTDQCHDITAYSEIGLAAGACSGNGILLDIRNPAEPKRIESVNDTNYAYWHSATFSNDGKKVVFTDEWGGGLGARCRANDPNVWGANALFNIKDNKELEFVSYYKLPAAQTKTENCVAHNGSIIPVPGRDIKVQAWYQGGISIMDFTDMKKPMEIAYFDRGPIDPKSLIMGGSWSAYWYNGHIYSSEIARGLDVFDLVPTKYLSKNEIAAAKAYKTDVFNVQNQKMIKYPKNMTTAKAYLDQLERNGSMSADEVTALRTAIAKSENGSIDASKLKTLAIDLEKKVKMIKSSKDVDRMNSLVAILQETE